MLRDQYLSEGHSALCSHAPWGHDGTLLIQHMWVLQGEGRGHPRFCIHTSSCNLVIVITNTAPSNCTGDGEVCFSTSSGERRPDHARALRSLYHSAQSGPRAWSVPDTMQSPLRMACHSVPTQPHEVCAVLVPLPQARRPGSRRLSHSPKGAPVCVQW